MPSTNAPHMVHPGDRFSRLLVVGFSHNDKRHRRHYTVHCDCGVIKTAQGALLRSGNTQSCGCLAREVKRNSRLPNDAGVINHIILQYKRHAKNRGIKWELDRDDVDRLVRQPCRYCGIAAGNIKRTKNHEGFAHNGIDRKDPLRHYVIGNVVPCCGRCNIAKGTMSEAVFIDWARMVADTCSR